MSDDVTDSADDRAASAGPVADDAAAETADADAADRPSRSTRTR